MPHRTLLSAEPRSRLFGISTERAEMARHYILEAADLALVLSGLAPVGPLGWPVRGR